MEKRAIALGADSGYISKLETTIKSICCYNENLRFYIFNDDIPSEWFLMMNKRLKVIQCEILDIKILDHTLKKYRLAISYLSYETFFRYFIPNFVSESKVLYLDSDIIVTDNLDELFEIELDEYALAGVEDYFDYSYTGDFNSGMMLINADLWKKEGACSQLLDLTEKHHEHSFGDQGILNMLFKDRWKQIDGAYNFMVGMDSIAHTIGNREWYELTKIDKGYLPKIIHFTGNKPWELLPKNRFREIWWFYNLLEWSDILLRKDIIYRGFQDLVYKPQANAAIFTDACEMENLVYLIEQLPNVHFSILAHTVFASMVISLLSYPNVSVYQCFSPFARQEVLEKMDFYLDINHYREVDDIISVVQKLSKPIFAFENTSHDKSGYSEIFSPDNPEKMVESIKEFMKQ